MIVSGTSSKNRRSALATTARKRVKSKPRSTQARAAAPISAPIHGSDRFRALRRPLAILGTKGGHAAPTVAGIASCTGRPPLVQPLRWWVLASPDYLGPQCGVRNIVQSKGDLRSLSLVLPNATFT